MIDHAAPPRPLAGIRVLEAGGSRAAAYLGRLLRDLGAEVAVVEVGDGHALRGDRAAFAYFAAEKHSVHLDPATPDGHTARDRLLAAADVVIRSGRPRDRWPDDATVGRAEAANPGLIVVDLSTFGSVGPLADEPGGDLIALASSGILSMMGTNPTDPEASPLRYPGELSSVFAAADAAVAVLGALHARRHDGRGQRLDVSAQAAVAAKLATALPAYTYTGQVPERSGRRGVCPWAFYQCADGIVLVQCTEDGQWRALVELLGDPEWGQLEMFSTIAQRVELNEAVEPLVAAAMAEQRVDEFIPAAHAAGVPASLVHSARDVVEWEHLGQRGFLQPIEQDGGGTVLAPTPPYRLHDQPPTGPRRAPALGEHTEAVLASWTAPTALPDAAPATSPSPAPAPLAGVRVLDLTWVWAGPFAAMQLAHLGAEVIKVESTSRVDVTRRLGPFVDDEPGLNRSGYFNQYNQGKKSICLDPTTPAGQDVLARLIARSDVVIDNMRAGALARMGFPDERLRQLNPRIVAVSMTGFGESGPERDRLAYGSIIDALSGVASVTGPVGGGPTDIPMSMPDPCAGIHAAIATLGALYRARTTGVGARVECAMLEAWMAANPWPVLGYSTTGQQPPAIGNRDPAMSPHGVFRGAAEGPQWVAIAVEDDVQFRGLACAVGRPDLATDPCFATVEARKANEDALEALVAQWTGALPLEEVCAALRAHGVTAWPVERMDAVVGSEHLAARDFLTHLPHPEFGVRPLAGVSWRASRVSMRAATPAPSLGEHTTEVLRDVLGLDGDEVAALEGAGALR